MDGELWSKIYFSMVKDQITKMYRSKILPDFIFRSITIHEIYCESEKENVYIKNYFWTKKKKRHTVQQVLRTV